MARTLAAGFASSAAGRAAAATATPGIGEPAPFALPHGLAPALPSARPSVDDSRKSQASSEDAADSEAVLDRMARRLSFVHTHTGERLSVPLTREGELPPSMHPVVNRFLRDHYNGAVGAIDPSLLALLARLEAALDARAPIHVISAYRSPRTNAALRSRSRGVATDSMHVHGRAIDVRLAGVALADVRDAALDLRAGGVGFYPGSDFVHLDTGRVRRW